MFKISNNCQKNTCEGTSFWIMIGLSCKPATMVIRKGILAKVFSCKRWKIFIRTPILQSWNTWMKNLVWIIQKQLLHKFSSKYVFLKMSQYSQKNTRVSISFCVCVKRITLCYCLCSSSPSSRFSASRVRSIGARHIWDFGSCHNVQSYVCCYTTS